MRIEAQHCGSSAELLITPEVKNGRFFADIADQHVLGKLLTVHGVDPEDIVKINEGDKVTISKYVIGVEAERASSFALRNFTLEQFVGLPFRYQAAARVIIGLSPFEPLDHLLQFVPKYMIDDETLMAARDNQDRITDRAIRNLPPRNEYL